MHIGMRTARQHSSTRSCKRAPPLPIESARASVYPSALSTRSCSMSTEARDIEDLLVIGLLEGSLGLEKVDKERDVLELEWSGAFGQLCGRCPLEQSGPSGAVVPTAQVHTNRGGGERTWLTRAQSGAKMVCTRGQRRTSQSHRGTRWDRGRCLG
eukprot:4581152-Prymnesium_polylepis.2